MRSCGRIPSAHSRARLPHLSYPPSAALWRAIPAPPSCAAELRSAPSPLRHRPSLLWRGSPWLECSPSPVMGAARAKNVWCLQPWAAPNGARARRGRRAGGDAAPTPRRAAPSRRSACASADGELNATPVARAHFLMAFVRPVRAPSSPALSSGACMPRRQSCLALRLALALATCCVRGCCFSTPRPRRVAFETFRWTPGQLHGPRHARPSPSASRRAATCRAGRAALAIALRSRGGERYDGFGVPLECSALVTSRGRPSQLFGRAMSAQPGSPSFRSSWSTGRACRATELRQAGMGDVELPSWLCRTPAAHSRARLPQLLSRGGAALWRAIPAPSSLRSASSPLADCAGGHAWPARAASSAVSDEVLPGPQGMAIPFLAVWEDVISQCFEKVAPWPAIPARGRGDAGRVCAPSPGLGAGAGKVGVCR